MGLETANSIEDLDENWPLGTDNVSQGDDHTRLIKSVLKSQFPALGPNPVTKTAEELNASGMPTGAVILSASVVTPTGWLLCNGQEANRGTYSALFTAIGTTYGAGNGTSTFNVPNMQNSVPGGASSVNSIGSNKGKDSWTEADLPNHDHTIRNGGANTHAMQTSSFDNPSGNNRVVDRDQDSTDRINTNVGGEHSHTINSNEGAGVTADNRQSTLYFNYIIKA